MKRAPTKLTPLSQILGLSARVASLLLLMVAPTLAASASDYQGEFIPFPQVTLHFHNQDAGAAQQHGSESLVDFFYTAKYGDWRLLGEAVVGDDEREIERLALGRVTPAGNQIWLGRYHTALGHWNHKFHHGMYLQTTIHRPSIIEWEDDGGVIPAHATGISLGGEHEVNDRIVHYALEFGLGPALGGDGQLVPFNLLDMSEGEHKLAVTAKLVSYSADDPFDDSGLFAGLITIPSVAADIREVQQMVLGAYSNYTVDKLIWHASLFYVGNTLNLAGNPDKEESFVYAYIQPEYNFDITWTYYGRWEKAFNAKDDLYLQQIPSFVTERALIGTRYQMESSQALKFELANMEQYGQRFFSIEVQWSAAMP